MNLLHIYGSPHIGGIEIFIENTLFHHRKFKPHIILLNEGIFSKILRERGFKNIFTLNSGRLRHLHKTIWSIFKIFYYIKKNDIKVIIGHGPHAWIYSGISAKLARIKSIFFAHGIWSKSDIFHPIVFIASRIKPSLIFANSKATLESVDKIMGKVKSEVVYIGIDIDRFKKATDVSKIREDLKIKQGSKVISVIGRIQEWKGQEYFVRAIPSVLAEFPETYFLIIGAPTFDKDKKYFDKIKQIVNDAGIKERVIFTGFRKDIPDIIALSDIIVVPSIVPESFGLIIIEGMALGVPVIATNMGGPAEIITDGEDGVLIPPKSVKALSESITRLLRDKELRTRLKDKAKQKVAECFSINKCVERMENIIEKELF